MNWNRFTPTGIGPTMMESRTWSCLVLSGDPTYVSFHSRSTRRQNTCGYERQQEEGARVARRGGGGPLESCSRHSKVMSKVYESPNLAGLSCTEMFRTWKCASVQRGGGGRYVYDTHFRWTCKRNRAAWEEFVSVASVFVGQERELKGCRGKRCRGSGL